MMQAAAKWMEQARYDLETARAMLASERYLYVLFCCQQAVEKAMKAIILLRTGQFPPRLHNLLRLAEVADLSMEGERQDFLGELSAYYIQTRYPEDIGAAGAAGTREMAEETLKKTEEVAEWLFSMLK